MENNTQNELGANPKVENNDHLHSGMMKDDHQMEMAILKKTAKLAKLNFIITIVGLGVLGYLHFSDKGSIDESLAKSKVALKQEMGKEFASKEELQTMGTDLTTKIDGVGGRISGLEVQGEQFQEELHKSAQLNARVSELQALLKKGQSSKPVAAESAKGKATSKSKAALKTISTKKKK